MTERQKNGDYENTEFGIGTARKTDVRFKLVRLSESRMVRGAGVSGSDECRQRKFQRNIFPLSSKELSVGEFAYGQRGNSDISGQHHA